VAPEGLDADAAARMLRDATRAAILAHLDEPDRGS
jgi:hypothetical protein